MYNNGENEAGFGGEKWAIIVRFSFCTYSVRHTKWLPLAREYGQDGNVPAPPSAGAPLIYFPWYISLPGIILPWSWGAPLAHACWF